MNTRHLFTSLLIFLSVFSSKAQKVVSLEVEIKIDSLLLCSKRQLNGGNLEKAINYQHDAEFLIVKYAGKSSRVWASALINKARISGAQGDDQTTLTLLNESISIWEKLEVYHEDWGVAYNNLGVYYSLELKEYERSAEFYTKAIEIYIRTVGDKHPYYFDSLLNLGNVLLFIGDSDKSVYCIKECLNWFRSNKLPSVDGITYGVEHPRYTEILNNLGIIYRRSGNYDLAENYYLECKQIQEGLIGIEHPSYAFTLNNLGALYSEIGLYQKAEEYYQKCKEVKECTIGNKNPSYAKTLNNLGSLNTKMKNYEKAERYYLDCKNINEELLGRDHMDYAWNLSNLGSLYKEMGYHGRAEEYYLECEEIGSKTIGKDHPDFAKILRNLGLLYHEMGDYCKAEEYYLECKKVMEKLVGIENPEYVQVISSLGELYVTMGENQTAVNLFELSTQIRHKRLFQSVKFLSEKDLGSYLNNENTALESLSSYLYLVPHSPNIARIAYDNALFQKGFLQTVAQRLNIYNSASPKADSLSRLLKSYRLRLSREYTKPIRERKKVTELERDANELESQLARVVSGYGEAMRQVKWREVQEVLLPNEAAVEFLRVIFRKPNEPDSIRYAALLLLPKIENPIFIDLCNEKEVDTLLLRGGKRATEYVNRLYQVGGRGLDQKNDEQIKSLYELLWQPMVSHLVGVKTVYFSKAGLLHRINLGAATINLDTVLADRYKLIELGSTRSLVSPDSRISKNNNALVMGGIQYTLDTTSIEKSLIGLDTISYTLRSIDRLGQSDDKSQYYWKQLEFSSREADNISATLNKSQIATILLKGIHASEEAFYKSVRLSGESPRVIHLATHGYFLSDPLESFLKAEKSILKQTEHPLIRSGLILAGGNNAWATGKAVKPEIEDGILTAYEISQLNLLNTELVVLSACETGLGDIEGNEGVYGLQRAFKISGVRYLIMSLWEIPDRESQIFMTKFYSNWLDRKLPIPEAFRETQAEMRLNGWTQHQWAGFVLLE